jgi:hypothetical protein
LKCAAEIGEFLAPPRAPATRRAMHRNFPCFSILGLTSIRALLSVIRGMTAMPAASPRTESDRADRHRRAAALPRRQCCATTNFSSAAAWPPGQACQCREKQQRPGLSPTAVIKAQVPRESTKPMRGPNRRLALATLLRHLLLLRLLRGHGLLPSRLMI